jgi:hypothetical protein
VEKNGEVSGFVEKRPRDGRRVHGNLPLQHRRPPPRTRP